MSKLTRVFTNRRTLVTALFGFSSSLPLPLVMGTLVAWMASEKVDLRTIGIFSLVQMPYTLKFLWAPLLDRYVPPFLNRRTGWTAVTQVLLIVAIAAMGFSDPVHAPWRLAFLAVIVAFISATQDIAIDAYRAELFEENELGVAAGVAVVGLRAALLVGGAVALILSDHMAWSRVYLLMAGLMSIGLVTSFFAPAPIKPAKPPRTLSEAVIQPFVNFLTRKDAIFVLLFIVFYKFGDAMAGVMTTPCMIQLGFSKTDIGAVNKGFGMLVTVFSSLIGGGIVAKIGIMGALWIFGFLQAISNLAFSGMAIMGHHYPTMVAAIGIENMCSGFGTAAFLAFLMSLTDKKFTATQYALFSSVFAQGRTLAGVPSGFLAKGLGWPEYFVACSCMAAPGLILLWWIRKRAAAPPASAQA